MPVFQVNVVQLIYLCTDTGVLNRFISDYRQLREWVRDPL